jgi:single-strand DNA-binding protein
MASFNKVLLMGNLTRDPELRYIPNGSAVTSFTLAMNRVYKLQTGEKKEEVTFMKVVVWGRMAEICGEYLKKGSGAFVEGRLSSRTWDGPDGQKRSAVEVIAMNVQFLNRPSGAGQGGGSRIDRDMDQSAGGGKEEMGEIQLEEMPEAGPKAEEETPF